MSLNKFTSSAVPRKEWMNINCKDIKCETLSVDTPSDLSSFAELRSDTNVDYAAQSTSNLIPGELNKSLAIGSLIEIKDKDSFEVKQAGYYRAYIQATVEKKSVAQNPSSLILVYVAVGGVRQDNSVAGSGLMSVVNDTGTASGSIMLTLSAGDIITGEMEVYRADLAAVAETFNLGQYVLGLQYVAPIA
jgi:hypothetical protein